MNRYVIMFTVLSFFSAGAQSYTVKKEKPKKVQTCAEISGDVVRASNELITVTSQIQRSSMDNVECILDGGKEAVFTQATYQRKLEEIEQIMTEATQKLAKAQGELVVLENKAKTKKN